MRSTFLRLFPGPTLLASVLGVAVGAGCGPDLGDCSDADFEQATRVAFQHVSGEPAYEGQALMQTSCGAGPGFCHAFGAEGSDRIGVPAGLSFDLPVACIEDGCDASTLDRLRRGRSKVIDEAHAIFDEVDRGDMPPGAEGDGVAEEGRRLFDYRDGAGNPLARIDSPDGRSILRNWLACGAPVVEETREPTTEAPGVLCNDGSEQIGDCIVAAEGTCVLEPTWPSIYDCILATSCTQCHGPGPLDQRADSNLDFETREIAYAQLLGDGTGAPASGLACDGMGTLVVPGDPDASLLVRKVEAAVDPAVTVCGDPMPVASSLSTEAIDAIRAWIAANAPEG